MKRPATKPRAVYAGSFDPLTVGHLWMIEEGVRLFHHLTVAIGVNPAKHPTFSIEDRLEMLRASTRHLRAIHLTTFNNRFLIDYAKEIGATHILRGIRSPADYEFERVMRNINGDLDSHITTVFLMPPRDIAEVSSSMVRGLIGPKGWKTVVREYVPASVYTRLLKTFNGRGERKPVA
ncbi:MAG TPA: pantetheine-phosphate adenylyltransferase [Verrucomicrobiae bacterium]|nr:pantetheine-phosphate adenylyltransferase [Verrucomicrobiae bacterium]